MRVVSLVPSITETLILFGLNPVGRTHFCIEPKEIVQKIPTVGGTKNPKIENIIELKPDLVIANQEENRKEDVEALQKAGLNVWVTYPRTVEEGISLMSEMKGRLSLSKNVEEVVLKCRETVKKVVKNRPKKPIQVVTFIWKNPWMVCGGDSYMNDMIKVAGGENPFESLGRYPQIKEEDLFLIQPKLLILPSEPFAFKQKDKTDWEMKCKTVGQSVRVELFSGEDLCWFGPRVEKGLSDLNRLFTSLKSS